MQRATVHQSPHRLSCSFIKNVAVASSYLSNRPTRTVLILANVPFRRRRSLVHSYTDHPFKSHKLATFVTFCAVIVTCLSRHRILQMRCKYPYTCTSFSYTTNI
ncbi:hypothetical protein Tcan_00980, partial [Toxocara canis]